MEGEKGRICVCVCVCIQLFVWKRQAEAPTKLTYYEGAELPFKVHICISSMRTKWRLNVRHADNVLILKSLTLALFGCILFSPFMHQTHFVFSWRGPSTDERKRLGGEDSSIISSHLSEVDA